MDGVLRWAEILLWLFLVHKVKTVTCQVKVQASTGDDVLLPCVYSGDDPLPEKLFVFWRDKDDSHVLDIKNSLPDPLDQSQRFKGRVSSFPEVFLKGNFSILMKDVQPSDSSPYDCHIPKVNFQQRVSLSVSGKRVEAETVTTTTTTAGPSGGAVVTPSSLHLTLLLLPLSVVQLL